VRRVALLAVLVVAGCGGGELSRDEFKQEANAICDRVNEELGEVGTPESLEDLATTLDEGIVVVRDAIAELRDLEPPSEIEGEVAAWIDQVEKALLELEKARDAADDNDQSAVGLALQSADDANNEGNQRAAALGLTTCAVQ
jgi:hypothetical protein